MAGADIHTDEASYFEEPLVGLCHFKFAALVKEPRR